MHTERPGHPENYANPASERNVAPIGAFGAGMSHGEAQCRTSGRMYLLETAARLRRKADGLEALASQIPEGWPHSADEALWQLVSDARFTR